VSETEAALGQLLAALGRQSATEGGDAIVLNPEASKALRRWQRANRAAGRAGQLGPFMRGLRERQGLSQAHVARVIARAVGPRSQGQVSRWEAGEGAPPDASELACWLDALAADDAARAAALHAAAADARRGRQ